MSHVQLHRPDWDEYFLEIASVAKKRSNCIRLQVGVVIIKDKHIIATGYSGTPWGIKNCFEGGCERCMKREQGLLKPGEEKDKCICVHAEQNAIVQSALHGISTKDAILYTTDAPCNVCAKLIINAGIKKIIAAKQYSDDFGVNLLKQAGIEVVILKLP
jgi:dCMP deaminase